MLILTVIQGPDTGKKFELPQHEPQLIGRSSEALPISDNTVSRRHAELTPDGEIWWIRDLASQNGTYVNGVELRGRSRLNPGDQLRVGNTVFVFGHTSADDASVVRLVREEEFEPGIAHRMASNEDSLSDSLVLAEPEPRAAAVEHLRVIYQLVTLTSQVTEVQRLLEAVMDLVFQVFDPERGVVMVRPGLEGVAPLGPVWGEGEGAVRPAVVRYRDTATREVDSDIRISRTILRHALRDAQGVLSSDAQTDARFASGDSVARFNIRSAICSPIRFQDTTYGAIYIDSSAANYTFVQAQLALMNAIGQHTGLALDNAAKARRMLATERLIVMGETVASLSHSIKNILQGLRGGADLVEVGLKKQSLELVGRGWDVQKRNIDRIMGLTMNMLAFGQRRRVEPTLTALGPLLEEACQLYERACRDKGVALIVDVDGEIPPVAIDAGLIHQAVLNLVGNAVDAAPVRTGVVTVTAAYRAGRGAHAAVVEIAVTDNGPGVPADKRDWIFEPFHSTKGLRGTGLGLAVTRRIATEHGGRIELESTPGHGATFRVVLPAEREGQGDPSATTGG